MLTFHGLSQTDANHYRNGGADAYGNTPERAISDGQGVPCRCCLRNIPKGQDMMIVAHRPFGALQPYAETGPIFLCADPCAPKDALMPDVLHHSPDYLLKGYGADERIVYGTGAVIETEDIPDYAESILAREDIAFVDVRSARNNCWLARVTLR